MAVAYSYVRFSTTEQKKGDSLRRQQEQTYLWAKTRGLTVDESLEICDLGRSAYRGKNLSDGGLGEFIAAIDDGRVQKGSYLVVENLDRLSRQQPMIALNLLQSIVERGVIVVTLSDNNEYTSESLNQNIAHLMMSILTMHRAHEESRVKGDRVRAAWSEKKQVHARAGLPITHMTPAWLMVEDQKFKVIEGRADVVRRVFDLATKEGMGQRAIVTQLKKENIIPIGRAKAWTETSVRRILQNKAVIGTYQPKSLGANRSDLRTDDGEAIENYYPQIIPGPQFHYAQKLREKSYIPRGPRGEALGTIFTGLVFCGKCGASMRRKGASRNDVHDRLRCGSSCGAKSWKYHPLEVLILSFLERDLMPHINLHAEDRKQTQEQLSEAEAVYKKWQDASDRLVDAMENGAGDLKIIVDRLKKVEQSREAAAKEVQRLSQHLLTLDANKFMYGTNEELEDPIRELFAGLDIEAAGVREKIRYSLRRVVDRIVVSDKDNIRTIRLEVGAEIRHIDIDVKKLSHVCREDKTFCGKVAIQHPVSGIIETTTP